MNYLMCCFFFLIFVASAPRFVLRSRPNRFVLEFLDMTETILAPLDTFHLHATSHTLTSARVEPGSVHSAGVSRLAQHGNFCRKDAVEPLRVQTCFMVHGLSSPRCNGAEFRHFAEHSSRCFASRAPSLPASNALQSQFRIRT